MRPDAVTPELRDEVFAADGWRCVAPGIARELDEPIDECRGMWGTVLPAAGRQPSLGLTVDHVKEQPMMGKRAPSDLRHLATICWHHHLDGWATAHRPALRNYLARRAGAAA